jgi:ABC-type transporter Mla MlaB component
MERPGVGSAPADFTVARTREGNGVRVLVSGELDIFTGPILRHRLADLKVDWMTLDLTGVTLIDRSGLHALLDVFKAASGRVSVISDGPTYGSLRTGLLEGCRSNEQPGSEASAVGPRLVLEPRERSAPTEPR